MPAVQARHHHAEEAVLLEEIPVDFDAKFAQFTVDDRVLCAAVAVMLAANPRSNGLRRGLERQTGKLEFETYAPQLAVLAVASGGEPVRAFAFCHGVVLPVCP